MKAYIHSEDLITPQALEIMGEVKRRVLGDTPIEFDDLPEFPPAGCTVFALGNFKATEDIGRVVPAPSVKQICSAPDIITRLGQAFQLLATPPVLPPFQYKVLNADQAREYLSQRGKVFAFDIETSGVVDEDRRHFDRVISIAIYDGVRAVVIPERVLRDVVDIRQQLNDFIAGNSFCTINGQFDFAYFDSKPLAHYDAQIAHYVLFPAAREHGLKPVAKKRYGFDDWDAPGHEYTIKATYDTREVFEDGSWHDARAYPKGSGYERIPREMLYEYNAFDVYATWPIYKWTLELLTADMAGMEAFKHLMRVQEMTMEWEAKGYQLDTAYMMELSNQLHEEKFAAEMKLSQIAGKTINPRSPKQVKEWFAEQGVNMASTDEDHITDLIEQAADPEATPIRFAEQLKVCRAVSKTLGTYVDGYLDKVDAAGRAYPGFKLIASSTGRIGGKGASLLTIPREKRLKKMVLPDPGQYMVGADLSQAELRVMAMESGDPWLIEAFQEGAGDFFDRVLSQAHPETDWFALHKRVNDHEATEDEANFYNNARAGVKGVIYGVSFNRQAPAIARAEKMSIREAQQMIDAFVRPGSPFAMWREDITERALRGLPIVTRFGRHFQSELVTYRNRQSVINSALAFTSQSTANDICLLAALNATPPLRALDYRILSSLHDAIYATGPEENHEAAQAVLTDSLEEAGRSVYGTEVRFAADSGHGRNMSEI